MEEIDVDAVLRRLRESNAQAYREPERSRRRRRQTAATRQRLRAVHVERQRQLAEADPDASPLKLARLAAGHSWATLADAAAAWVSSIARAESGQHVGEWTWLRLAGALKVKPDGIRP
jgi:hypothetical protein